MGFSQRAYGRGRDGHAPVTAGVGGGGVVDAVQVNGDACSFRLIAGAGEQQIFTLLGRVNYVVRRQRVDTDDRRHGIDHHIQGAASGIAGAVGHGDIDGPGTVRQPLHDRRGQAKAPVPRRIHHRGVIDAVNGDGHPIARCRTGDGAAQDLRL
ncbi:Uncharacterised protein [Enterobacter cloacae]|nr:Uncharacterised protein [Enterobacter cloacae]